jgi:hypothetical protein
MVASQSTILRLPSATLIPSNSPEFTSTQPSLSVNAASSGTSASLAASRATTRTMGSWNCVANSKSRSSWPGTAMIAPVPYSMST